MHDPDPTNPTDTARREAEEGESAVAEELAAAEADLEAVEAVLEAIDRDDLDSAEEIVTGLDSGGADPD